MKAKVIVLVMIVTFASSGVAIAQRNDACWGQATAVFAQMGEMGQHASQQPTPRLGLRNLARALFEAGVIPDDSMQALGAFVADELGLSIYDCMDSDGAGSTTFRAPLSGSQEVPIVDTNATGIAVFRLNRDGDELTFRLIVANIEDIRFAHIHFAPVGINGPVQVTLYPAGGPDGTFNGVLAEGTILETSPGAELPDLEALVDAMRLGYTYVNVHTELHPGGEIRGQIQ